jgi:MFS transporter, MHS family, proline/betaine transporter
MKINTLNKRVMLSAIIGNGAEFYDFALFGAFSVVFSKLFFTGDSFSSLISTLSIFGLGFFVRPLGSIFFGYLGDRFGRKKALGYSIIFMGVFTFLIGCLPVFESVGYLAPLLLLCCRLGQGFCLGGENNGSAIFLLEHHKQRKAYAGALILTGGAIGTITATLFAALTNLSFMPAWAWRLPFLFGILIGFLGAYIRNSLEETPEYLSVEKQKREKTPLLFVLKNYPRQFLCAIGIGGLNGVLAYTLVVYTSVYLSTVVHYPLTNALLYSCVGLVIFGTLAPLFGHLADKREPKKIMSLGCVLIFVLVPLNFYLLQQQTFFSILIAIGSAALLMSLFNGPTNAFLQDLFPAKVRYTGVALGYAIGAALLGGTQPLICTYLIEYTQNPYAPVLYLSFAATVGLGSLYFSRKHEDEDLGFSQMTPEYSRPSNVKSKGMFSLEKNVA